VPRSWQLRDRGHAGRRRISIESRRTDYWEEAAFAILWRCLWFILLGFAAVGIMNKPPKDLAQGLRLDLAARTAVTDHTHWELAEAIVQFLDVGTRAAAWCCSLSTASPVQHR
jgi:hypothetical protein